MAPTTKMLVGKTQENKLKQGNGHQFIIGGGGHIEAFAPLYE